MPTTPRHVRAAGFLALSTLAILWRPAQRRLSFGRSIELRADNDFDIGSREIDYFEQHDIKYLGDQRNAASSDTDGHGIPVTVEEHQLRD
jgi:hypothetical protein